MSNHHERPSCRRCQLSMQVARIEPECGHELWVFRCVGCGRETSLLLEPLASPQLATAVIVAERQLI
jgi:hypothetical protein